FILRGLLRTQLFPYSTLFRSNEREGWSRRDPLEICSEPISGAGEICSESFLGAVGGGEENVEGVALAGARARQVAGADRADGDVGEAARFEPVAQLVGGEAGPRVRELVAGPPRRMVGEV